MGIPGGFNPRGEDWIGRKFAELEQQFRELAAANVFGTTGITPKDGGTDFDGYVNVNGPMEVNGPMSITGALNLPAGIIGNDALANPVKPLAVHDGATNIALSPGPNKELLRTVVTVPAGFSQALVYAGATLTAGNNAAAADDVYLGLLIAGDGIGASSQTSADPGSTATVPANGSKLITGLSGSFAISTMGSSYSAVWPASGSNYINVDAIVIFLR